MRLAPPRASQRRETRAQVVQRSLEFIQENLNIAVVHKIGETSLNTIMELNDGSDSEWLEEQKQ
jgi:hypothetical protein